MNTIERRKQIIHILGKDGQVKVEELARNFDVSTVTIRNDLKYLENQGMIHRAYGGAIIRDSVGFDPAFSQKSQHFAAEKKRIAKAAAELIYEGDSIILDSGTTTLEIALNLKNKKNITVMTDSIMAGVELSSNKDIKVMLTGGIINANAMELIGPQAEEALKRYHFDKVFLGADGIDSTVGLTTPNIYAAHLNKIMIEVSKQVIVVSDSSKFGRKSLNVVAGLDELDMLITDDKAPENFFNELVDSPEFLRV